MTNTWAIERELAYFDFFLRNHLLPVMTSITVKETRRVRMGYNTSRSTNPRIPAEGESHKIKVEAFHVVDDKRHDYKVRVREGCRF